MATLSRNQRRKLVYLAFSVCAKEVKHCKIEQDRLVRRYPDTNYGLTVETTTPAQAEHLSKSLDDAFKRRGFIIYDNKTDGSTLRVSGFYQNENQP